MIRKIIAILFFLSLVLSSFFTKFAYAQETNSNFSEETIEGKIIEIINDQLTRYPDGRETVSQTLNILITSGIGKGDYIVVETGDIETVKQAHYQSGDQLIISSSKDVDGNQVFYISDQIRRRPLIFLFILFSVITIVIGGWRGISSLISLVVSFLVIFKMILPRLSQGSDPVLTAILASLIIVPVTFYLSHGLNKKTTLAIIGTFISLVITGWLAKIAVDATKLTGFVSEEVAFLQFSKGGSLNVKGMLLAGIIIGTLGVLDDVTVSQAAIVQELKKTDPDISFKNLFLKAMNVGRDHIASMVNTLVLVYTGSSLPLLLLFLDSSRSFSEVVNYEIIAVEITRTLVGSIGLIAAVPITTLLAARSTSS